MPASRATASNATPAAPGSRPPSTTTSSSFPTALPRRLGPPAIDRPPNGRQGPFDQPLLERLPDEAAGRAPRAGPRPQRDRIDAAAQRRLRDDRNHGPDAGEKGGEDAGRQPERRREGVGLALASGSGVDAEQDAVSCLIGACPDRQPHPLRRAGGAEALDPVILDLGHGLEPGFVLQHAVAQSEAADGNEHAVRQPGPRARQCGEERLCLQRHARSITDNDRRRHGGLDL